MSIPIDPKSGSNHVLSTISPEEYGRLIAHGQEVKLEVGAVLYEANEPIRHVHFMLDGMASIVTTMQDGTTIEVCITGKEGMVGLPAIESGSHTVPTRAFMQIAGRSIRVDSAPVRDEFYRGGSLNRALMRYFQFVLVQISQSGACNRLHDLEERLSRWLLMVHDRIQQDEFILTHDFLSQMLGTRRSSVTLAAGTLQRAGMIDYRRGRIRIVDREALESASCECYSMIKASWDAFLKTDNNRRH